MLPEMVCPKTGGGVESWWIPKAMRFRRAARLWMKVCCIAIGFCSAADDYEIQAMTVAFNPA